MMTICLIRPKDREESCEECGGTGKVLCESMTTYQTTVLFGSVVDYQIFSDAADLSWLWQGRNEGRALDQINKLRNGVEVLRRKFGEPQGGIYKTFVGWIENLIEICHNNPDDHLVCGKVKSATEPSS